MNRLLSEALIRVMVFLAVLAIVAFDDGLEDAQ